MALITQWDKEYKLTKAIKQGIGFMNPDFEMLAGWIFKTYNAKPINIIYDKIATPQIMPRLEIIFEFEREKNIFYKSYYAFDEVKQKAITLQFKNQHIVNEIEEGKSFFDFLTNKKNEKYDTEKLFVIFSNFESTAKEEAISKVSKEEIKILLDKLNNKDIWNVYGSFGVATFFLYTDKQVTENANNGMREYFSEEYFNVLKKHDEFDYFNRNDFSIKLDSKENFDDKYQGSWFYYDR